MMPTSREPDEAEQTGRVAAGRGYVGKIAGRV